MICKMLAAVLNGVKDLRLDNVQSPEISSDEILIKVHATGICGTDIHIYRGEWKTVTPIILGHEFSGIIAEVGYHVRNLGVGDSVVVEPNIICGTCYFCRMPERNHFCENLKTIGVTIDGAFAEYVKVKAENVYKTPKEISLDEAALIEPLACCVRGIDQAKVRAGDTVAIIGAGPIGLILLQLAKQSGASFIVQTDMEEKRLKLARDLGADSTVCISHDDPVEAIMGLTNGYGVDVAIEAVGSTNSIIQAMKVTRRGGRLNIFGVAPQEAILEVKPFDLYDKELTITTSYRSPFTFQRAIKIASSRCVKLKPLISHVFKLEEIQSAFEVAEKKLGNPIKVIVKP
ncbi:MAG: zinc-dependent alcohol dehydrogenase family protein [Candidatus Jordarchaeaceae archaeon]